MSAATTEFSMKHVSPILGVADMEAALMFYRDVLLFEVVLRSPDYSIVRRDHGSLSLRLVSGVAEAREIYIEVTGIDALWEYVSEYQGAYKTRALFTQDYGMREFHIISPDGCLIFVGQAT